VPNNCLLTKTQSTGHLPLSHKAKEGKRIYTYFDKDIAARMFGYRVNFDKKEMKFIPSSNPNTDHQVPSPISKFTQEIVSDLSQTYTQLPHFATKQRFKLSRIETWETYSDERHPSDDNNSVEGNEEGSVRQ